LAACGTVILTGGAGFIGSHTARLLGEKGCRVVVVDIREPPARPAGDTTYLRLDVSDWRGLREGLAALRGDAVDAVIHLAAVVSVEEARRSPRRTVVVNVEGTLNMLEAARLLDARVFVYASSAAVYGEPLRLPVDEEHPLRPINLYGDTKLMGEMLVKRYSSDYGLKAAVLRYFNVYGPGMRGGPYAGVIHAFITRLLRGQPPVIYGDGRQTRDFVHVRDVARANYAALASGAGGVFNIGTGRETSINDLYRILCGIVGRCPPPVYAPPRPGDVRRSVASIERAAKTLGWRPGIGLEHGLRETVEWYRRRLGLRG